MIAPSASAISGLTPFWQSSNLQQWNWASYWQQRRLRGPITKLSCVGIQLDKEIQTSRLPKPKLVVLRDLVSQLLLQKKSTLCQVQSLLYHLNVTCWVVPPGCTFCAHLVHLITGAIAPHQYFRLILVVKENLKVWLAFLKAYNEVSFWQDLLITAMISNGLICDKEVSCVPILSTAEHRKMPYIEPDYWKAVHMCQHAQPCSAKAYPDLVHYAFGFCSLVQSEES